MCLQVSYRGPRPANAMSDGTSPNTVALWPSSLQDSDTEPAMVSALSLVLSKCGLARASVSGSSGDGASGVLVAPSCCYDLNQGCAIMKDVPKASYITQNVPVACTDSACDPPKHGVLEIRVHNPNLNLSADGFGHNCDLSAA